MAVKQKIRLGDLLVSKKLITQGQLDQALERQVESNKKLGALLIELGFIDQVQLTQLLSDQLRLPIIHLQDETLDPDVSGKLPESYARRFLAILLNETQDRATVGMVDPLDIIALDEVERILGKTVDVALVYEEALLTALDLLYRRTEDISDYARTLGEELKRDDESVAELSSLAAGDAPVVKLLRSLFEDAAQVDASDIHIEPDENVLHLRLRVDGVLQEQTIQDGRIASALAQRLKLMAGLNIAERRLPQDGRFRIKVHKKIFDVRLSTMPIQDGESIVMRLLAQDEAFKEFEKLGMPPALVTQFKQLIHQPHGIVLVTGPTGSGKSTTLYAALTELNQVSDKVITIEDPVEYRLHGVNQVQVKPSIGLDFATVLRTCLRQDPDIILVGEMRDLETAEIAMRAALTGHLVLSTLHTNDAASAPTRLLDMGIRGYLVASTVRGVLAQRLVRRLCESCREKTPIDKSQMQWLTAQFQSSYDEATFFSAKGCNHCNNTGYKGRLGVYELLILSAEMLDALRNEDPGEYVRIIGDVSNNTLGVSAMALAVEGVTSIAEVQALVGSAL